MTLLFMMNLDFAWGAVVAPPGAGAWMDVHVEKGGKSS